MSEDPKPIGTILNFQEIAQERMEAAPEPEPPKPKPDHTAELDTDALMQWVPPDVARQIVRGGLEHTQALSVCLRWLESSAAFLVLSGGVGVGKTVAAIAALYERGNPREKVYGGVYTPGQGTSPVERYPADLRVLRAGHVPKAIDPWRDDLHAGWRRESPTWPRLVLDDLGTERDDPRFNAALEELIDARQNPGRYRTIITTNLPRQAIRPRYGDRITDRLNGAGTFVAVQGESRRRKGTL